MGKQVKRYWKVLAIIFIILFLLETAFFCLTLSAGATIIKKESTCANEVCLGEDSFYFDSSNNICYCYKNNEIVIKEKV